MSAEPEKGSDEAILQASRDGLQTCIEAEYDQRELMRDDLRFASLDQWPADLRADRENDVDGARPCLTVDQCQQYITQVSNDMAANRPSIKIRPVDDVADPATADIYQSLIRHIEDRSNAHIAYQTSGASAVTVGLGYFRIVSEYVSPDSFDQELIIKRVPDTFSVYLSQHLMPDGSDANEGWVFEDMPLEKFKRDYPKAKCEAADFTALGATPKPTWRTEKTVTVCEYFYKDYTDKELLFLADGRTMFADAYEKLEGEKPEITGRRPSQQVVVKWCKHTGIDVLEKEDLKGKYIPIIEEIGKESIVDGKRVLWGLVRPAKDSLRAYNYWISAMTEKMALAPKAPFIGAVGQFKTMGAQWDKANVKNYAKLEYDPLDVNGNAIPAPRREQPMQMEQAMAQMLSIMQNNVKSSLGMYKASVGEAEAQQSGRAILALKKESDTGTSHFGQNQSISITHGGRILLDLIPYYWDKKRVERLLGEDGKVTTVQLDPTQKESMREIPDAEGKIKRIYNLGVGTFDVTVSVGPGYTTSRQEAATILTELANSAKDPMSANVMRYLAIKSSDFHGSEEMTKMLKALLPPQVQDGQDQVPQLMQKLQQMQQQGMQMREALQKLQQENVQLKSGAQEEQAKIQMTGQAKAEELRLKAEAQAEEGRLARVKAEEEARLARDRAEADIALKRSIAEAEIALKRDIAQAEHEIAQKKLDRAPVTA